MSKISENPSIVKLKQDFDGAEAFLKLAKPLGLFNKRWRNTSKEMESTLKELKAKLTIIMNVSNKFNEYFGQDGWVAYEKMNMDVMQHAVEEFELGDHEAAKQGLIDYYSAANIEKRLFTFNRSEAFRARKAIIRAALNDYAEERYLSCIPLLLMICDGIVNDTSKQSGFAAQNTNMDVWDSIAGHSTGLSQLKTIITASRTKTTTDPIFLPYRNGILHGRDLNYGNKELAAKCWGMLFAISDWALAHDSEGARKEVFEQKEQRTRKPLLKTLKEFSEHNKKMDETKKGIDRWQARTIAVGIDIPESGTSIDYVEGTPERSVVEFIELINRKNYGHMFEMMHRGYTGYGSPGAQIGGIREDFSDLSISEFSIVKVDDYAPAICEVTVAVSIRRCGIVKEKECTFRMIFTNGNETAVFGSQQGIWKIVNGYNQINAVS